MAWGAGFGARHCLQQALAAPRSCRSKQSLDAVPAAPRPPPPPPPRKSQHVDGLLRRYPAKAINPDRSVFDLALELRDGKGTALRISLPPHFPQERPALSVLLPVVHPSVDATGRLHTPGVSGWVYGTSALVDVVAEAVATLTSAVVDARQPGGGPGAQQGGGRGGCLLAHQPVPVFEQLCCSCLVANALALPAHTPRPPPPCQARCPTPRATPRR